MVANFVKAGNSNLTPEQASKYATFFEDAAKKAGTTIEAIKAVALANSSGFDLLDLRTPALGGTAFDFESGATIGSTIPMKGPITSSKYLTATNVLTATNSSGQTFVKAIKEEVGSEIFDKTVVPIFEGIAASVREQVDAKAPTADMVDFWNVGVANGSFPSTEAGIQQAINQYSAAITLSVIEADGKAAAAWATLGGVGIKSTITEI